MAANDSVCPVCLRADIEKRSIKSAVPYAAGFENRDSKDDGFWINCRSCGEFVVTFKDFVNLQSERLRSKWNPVWLSSLLREQTIHRLPPFWLRYGMDPYGPLDWIGSLVPIELEELLRKWPRGVLDRMDRALCNLAHLSATPGDKIDVLEMEQSVVFAQGPDEKEFMIRALVDRNLLDGFGDRTVGTIAVALSAKGWEHVDNLRHGQSDRKRPVFVAMWFGGKKQRANMDDLFKNGIEPAIRAAGYDVTRSDLVQHNDWIMDKILGDIRVSPFVVADFTRHVNGVYLEAGFARGLGIQVIHTCRADRLKKAHFDTAQLNHVTWTTPADLNDKLYHRIMGSIGQGPYASKFSK